jgi:hypothetical protein
MRTTTTSISIRVIPADGHSRRFVCFRILRIVASRLAADPLPQGMRQ